MNDMVIINQLVSYLKRKDIISSINIVFIDESLQKNVFKVRCNLLPSRFKLDIRLIQMETEIIYSYQLFYKQPIMRWDNAPHFPAISTFPHHFHNTNNVVKESNLSGNILSDIDFVLGEIKQFLIKNEFFNVSE